ncbi:hypothetical protein [Nonomuraea typhae]|uniref:hypothetical protein n=1 Tax=Nonomuraea typhae TaxID=2603600 RepID=UPI0012FA9828|nr:hypothetical protein [Nonomuraea typhae]
MKNEITFTTAGGGTVVWKWHNDDSGGRWVCQACGDKGWGYDTEANKHAGGCWAR